MCGSQKRVVLDDGTRGVVTRSGHGFYYIELDNNGGRVQRRVMDLQLERDRDGRLSGAS